MLIKYKFATGEVTEADVSDEIGAVITASRKAEHALEERNRYHCYSLDAIGYEGLEYGECDEYPIEDDSAERAERIKTEFQSVAESIDAVRKKFLKNYHPTP